MDVYYFDYSGRSVGKYIVETDQITCFKYMPWVVLQLDLSKVENTSLIINIMAKSLFRVYYKLRRLSKGFIFINI